MSILKKMYSAFNKQTKKLVMAWSIFKDTSYIKPEEDIWYVNPDDIENYSEILKQHDLEFIECRYKKGHDRHYESGKITAVTPHFFIKNREELGINLIAESQEHKKIKNLMFQMINSEDNIKFVYSHIKNKQTNELEYKEIFLKDLDIDWQNLRLSNKEDFFETNIIDIYNTRRVDLLLPFKSKDDLLGYGLAIEIQLSKQSKERTKGRTIERALKGYSTIWIDKEYFLDINSDELFLISNIININVWAVVLYNNSNTIEQNILDKIQKYSRELDEKYESMKKAYSQLTMAGHLCLKCKSGVLIVKKNTINNTKFLACSNYPECKFTGGLD